MSDDDKDKKVVRKKRHFIFPASSADVVAKFLRKKHPADVETKLYGSHVTYEDGETVVTLELRTTIRFILLFVAGAGLAWALYQA